ncbi:MAG: leucine-rich repeat domain-containing protein, partial [Lachnospiraceae bacterium]|nr:leucine-rich repeat domain-containing protein [Lachnospiraceae bacterium]
ENAAGFAQDGVPKLVRTIKDQILGKFRLCGTVLLKYLGNESRVAVPDGVTAIAEEAFAGKEEIDRILLPDSLLSIGAGAFRGCLLLQTIVLPPAIKRIGAGAFENCVKLLRISLPETIGKIEEMTFRHCRKLKQVNFGAGLLEIGEQAFYGCASLTEIVLPDGLLEIGAMAFYRCRKLSGIELPASLKRVGNLAFAQGGVEKAHVFCGCEGFGTGLFSDCTHLNTLCLHKGVRHIPDKMASGCGALSRVELPGTVCSIGRNTVERTAFLEAWKEERQAKESGKTDWMGGDSTDFSGQIFWDGSELNGEVEIPGYYHMVAGGAFYGNHHITSVALSGKITFVGGAAFKGCSKLSRVVWPEGIHDIQPEVFSGCAALTWIQGAPAWRTVGDRAFYGCKKLSRLCMDKMEIIGKEAFFGCSCFQMGEAERVRMVGEAAFDGTPFMNHEENRGGKEAVLPALQVASIVVGRLKGQQFGGIADGVTRIAPYAFYRDPDIVSLRLPESVCLIGEGAFLGCDNLKEIIFPVGNCRIEARAFEKCTSLKRIRLCSDMVGERAFAWCTSLLLVEISGAASVGRSAFEGCKSLEEFSFCERKESGGECRESDDWKEAGNPDRKFMEIEIADSCFCGCGKLHTIDLVGVSMIGRYAFSNCDSLKRIVLSCDTPVAPYAFADCGRLMEICISGGREGLSLQEYALSGCTALRRVCFEKDKVSADRTGEDVPSIDPKSGGAGIRIWEFQVFKDLFSEKIPESIRMIFYSALSCFEVEDERILYAYHGSGRILKIPSGIEQIKAEVFRDQTIIEQVSIPESVEYIGARAFHGTAFIEGQKERSPMVIINQMLLDGSSCVGRVIIPPQIKRVCGWAFANGMGIKEICFTSRFVRVEEFAFRNCINLEKIELPGEPPIRLYGIADRERELPPVAKQIVTERLNCFKTDGENALIECTGNITKLLVADGITRIGENVFRESNLMTEIILPPSVTSVGKGAFFGCKWLKTVRQPLLDFYPRAGMEGKEDKPQSCGIREIADMAFANCGRLEYIELSNSFQRLGKRAFEHCTALMEVYLPEGIEEIPERTFFRCHSLKKVVFPSTLKRIGKEAFAFCGQLEFAGLPDGVMIGERAFVR